MTRAVDIEGRGVRVNGRSVGVGSAIPDTVVDNYNSADADPPGIYESGDTIADYYSGATGSWERSATDAIEGDMALRRSDATVPARIYSLPGDGLNRYPDPGETVGWLVRSGSVAPGIYLSVEESGGQTSGYYYNVLPRSNEIRVARIDDDSFTQLDATSITLDGTTWYWAESDIPSDGDNTLELRLYELTESDLSRGSLLATTSATDDNYRNSGIGFRSSNGGSAATAADWERVL